MLTAADSWRERSGAVRSEGHWIAALHHTAQRLLERRSVVISFAEPADDALVARLLSGPPGRTIGDSLSDPAQRFLDRLTGEIHDPVDSLPVPFTAKDGMILVPPAPANRPPTRVGLGGWQKLLAPAARSGSVRRPPSPCPQCGPRQRSLGGRFHVRA